MRTKKRIAGLLAFAFSLVLGWTLCPPRLLAQDVEVDSADPNTAAQGTTSLNVIITGKHFDKSAKAQFFVTGTTNPGGITVNSTTFVNPTQLVANITVSSTATTTKFDTVVTMSATGRTGKGIELFSVVKKGTKTTCTLAPLPDAFTQVGILNSGAYRGAFGSQVRARRMTLGTRDVYVVAVGSSLSGKVEVFFLDPTTGQVLDGTYIGSTTQPQPHLSLPIPLNPDGSTFGVREMQMGDVNADGAPEVGVGNRLLAKAYAFVGSVQNGILSYSSAIPILPPTSQAMFGIQISFGDLDGVPGDEMVVGAPGGGSGGKNLQNGKAYVYKYNGSGFGLWQTLAGPAPGTTSSDNFGGGVAVGDVTGGAAPDLAAAANSKVYIFPGFIPANPPISVSAGPRKVAAADVDGDAQEDLVSTPSSASVLVFKGPVSDGETPEFTLTPVAGLDQNFGQDIDTGDVNADLMAEILAGAPNASNCPSVSNIGAAYVYLSAVTTPPQAPTPYLLQPPSLGASVYGWAVGTAAGSHLFFVGEIGRTVGGIAGAGQVYVYKVN